MEKVMGEQTIAVDLPRSLYQRLQRLADVTHQPIADLVVQAIDQNVPPLLDDLPAEMRQELIPLETLSDEALWAVARSHTSRQDHERYVELLHQERTGALAVAEATEFEQLYQATNVHMLRKAYACLLLKWRGYALPSPTALT
jgi:predicted DNA-binding protein